MHPFSFKYIRHSVKVTRKSIPPTRRVVVKGPPSNPRGICSTANPRTTNKTNQSQPSYFGPRHHHPSQRRAIPTTPATATLSRPSPLSATVFPLRRLSNFDFAISLSRNWYISIYFSSFIVIAPAYECQLNEPEKRSQDAVVVALSGCHGPARCVNKFSRCRVHRPTQTANMFFCLHRKQPSQRPLSFLSAPRPLLPHPRDEMPAR